MDSTAAATREFRYDAFISYSHKDREFSRRLEQELGRYRPPKDLGVPQRYLRIFRNEADFAGGEFHCCSIEISETPPSSLSSARQIRRRATTWPTRSVDFVSTEERNTLSLFCWTAFPTTKPRARMSTSRAFPEQLVRLLPMPLAADYRGFDGKRDKIRKGAFGPAWFKTLADMYADYGVDRARIEQRERRREAQNFGSAAVSGTVALALIGLTIWALLSRNEATRQRQR